MSRAASLLLVALGVVAVISLFTLISQRKSPQATAIASTSPGSPWFLADSRFVNHHVLVKVGFKSNVEPRWWILDTGSTHNLVDGNYAARFNRRVKGSIRDVNQPGASFSAQSLEQGFVQGKDGSLGAAVDLSNAAVLDLGPLASSVALPLGGIVGYPFFSQHVISIDFPRQQVWLRDRNSHFSLPPQPSHKTPTILNSELSRHNLLLLPVSINSLPQGPWSLDTGSNISIATPEFAQKHRLEAGAPMRAQLVNRAIDIGPLRANVSVGGTEPINGTIYVPLQHFANAVQGLDGNLGTDLLQDRRITIDATKELIVLD